MPTEASFRSSNGDLYVYLENPTLGSCAIGTDFADNNKLKIVMSDILDNVTPGGTFQLSIDPATNGDITITPRGAGDVVIPYLGVTGTVVQNDNTGALYSHFNLDLPTTSDSAHGNIRINSVQFAHSFGTDNTFIGSNAGNYSLTGIENVGVGFGALASLTSGIDNTGIGLSTLTSLTTASNNVSVGQSSLGFLVSGDNNTSVGTRCLDNVTSGSGNTAMGALNWGAGSFNGSNNLLLASGFFSNNYNGTESSNILIQNDGVLGESNVMRIGTSGSGDGEQNKCFLAATYGVTPGGASIEPIVMDSSGQMGTQAQLTVTQGGTGLGTLTSHGILIGAGTGNITATAEPSDGQLLIGKTGSAPVLASLTAGSNITVTPGAGTITISAAGGGSASIFSAYLSSSTSNNVTGDNTSYQIIFDTELFDTGSNYDNTTGIFTAPTTGKYMFIAAAVGQNIGAQTTGQLRVISATHNYDGQYLSPLACQAAGGYLGTVTHAIVSMTAADTVHIEITYTGGTKTVGVIGSTELYTSFHGYLIG